MGWSCEYEAGRVMEAIFEKVKGNNGLIDWNGDKYFLEPSSKEYEDGRIYLKVFKITGKNTCRPMGGFYIMPGGRISESAFKRFPFLKEILN